EESEAIIISSQTGTTATATTETTTETTQPQGYTDVSAQEAYLLIQDDPDLVIIDVSPNYEQGHIPGAVNYPVSDGTLDSALENLDKDKTYLVYCHTDSASISGTQRLVDAGFMNVYRLEGNYQAWLDAGYEIEK
ncbi:MAG: rhodanese-like domain-containing protein, partial [Candidatus Dojkabacteria bacterium]|nr:rhodanese-like domain-containing protein [Candidatus Dojkabacteria bacterium]